MEIVPLFASDVGATLIAPKSFNKQEIVDTIIKNYNKSSLRNEWKGGSVTRQMHHSYGDWDNKEYSPINVEILCDEIYPKVIEEYLNSLGIFNKFKFYAMNYTAVGNGQGMDRHWHPLCDFSMVHYLQIPTDSDTIKFYNPIPYVHYANQGSSPSWVDGKKLDNTKLSTRIPAWNVTLKEDLCIMFPNYLEHEIPVYEGDGLRMSIVTNITVEDE